MAVMVPLVFLANGISKGNWLEAFLFALAIAVGLTPEMLPMIVTVNLSNGAIAMSRKKVIVKRLNSIQNFGAMDVLCTDKTGTITEGKIVLEKHLDVRGQDSERVLHYGYLNSYYQTGLKNPMDEAILDHEHLKPELQVDENYRKNRRATLRFPAASHVGDCGRQPRPASPDLQGGCGRAHALIHPCRD
jgi:Mg2+-importing ATPase